MIRFMAFHLFLSQVIFRPLRIEASTHTLHFAGEEYCPYICEDAKKKGSDRPGFSAELIQEAARKINFNVTFHLLPWTRSLAEAKNGRFDGIFLLSANRSEDFFLSDVPIAKTQQCIIKRADDPWIFNGFESLKERVIGLAYGYDYTEIRDYLLKYGSDAKRVNWIGGEQISERNLQKILLRRIDLTFDDFHVASDTIKKKNWHSKLTRAKCFNSTPQLGYFYLGFPKNRPTNQQLMLRFSKALEEFLTEEKYIQLLRKYDLDI